MPIDPTTPAQAYGLSDLDYEAATAAGQAFSDQVYNTPTPSPTYSNNKQLSLEERALRKAARLNYSGEENLLGFAREDEFYDADTIRGGEFTDGLRLGNRLSSKDLYANAPEKGKIDPNNPDYVASRVALQRFARGLPAESKEFYDELRSDPTKLAKYTSELSKTKSDLLQVTGVEGNVGKAHGRQLGQVYNPNLGGESLQDRLLATGNASMYDHGQEKGRAGNMVDALQYGLGSAASGIADAFVDTATWMVKKGYEGFTGASEKEATAWINDNASLFSRDKSGNFTGLDDYGEADMYGYDNSRTKEVTANLGKAFESGSTADMAGAVLDGVLTAGPEFFLESAGEMAAALTGAGVVGIAGKYSNEIMEERQANMAPGETLTMGDRAFATVVGSAVSLFNKLGVDEIVGKTKVVKSAMNLIGKPGGDTATRQILSNIALKSAETAGKGAYEGLEEIAQEMLQKFGEKYGTEAQDELLSSETGKELFQAFGGGFAGGATPGAAVATVGGVKDAIAKSPLADVASKAASYGKGIVEDVADIAKGLKDSDLTTYRTANAAKKVALTETEDFKEATSEEQKEILKAFDAKATEAEKSFIEVNKRNKAAEGDSLSTAETINEEPVAPTDSDSAVADAEIEAVKQEAPVASVSDDANTPEVDSGLNAFDEGYAAIIANLEAPLAQVNEAKEILAEGGEDIDAATEEKYTVGVTANAAALIGQLNTLKDQVSAAGAGPKAIAAMEDKIAKLIPLTTAKSTAELTSIITSKDVTTPQRVRAVLGSSAASIEQLETVGKSTDITARDKKLVEAKIAAIKTYTTVSAEKLIGGGQKPSVFQWLSQMTADGGLTKQASDNIQDFIDGQRRKLKAFEVARDKFVADSTLKSVRVEYGEKNVYHRGGLYETLAVIQAEMKAVDSLQEFITPVAVAKPAEEVETIAEPVVTPEAAKPAPKVAEVKLPTARQVAIKIYKNQELNEADLQTQANEGEEIERLLAKGKKAKEVPKKKEEAPQPDIADVDFNEFVEDGDVEEEVTMDLEEEEAPAPLEEIKRTTTSIDEKAVHAQMYEINDELSELYAEVEYLSGDDLKKVEDQIDKKTKQMLKLVEKLGLKGTVGDRLLDNPPPRPFKKDLPKGEVPTRLSDYFEVKAVGNALNISEDIFGSDFDTLATNVGLKEGEKTYFEGAKEQTNTMIEAIKSLVKDKFDHTGIAAIDVAESTTVNRFQSISRLLLQGAPKGTYQPQIDAGKVSKDGYTFPQEVMTAIALAANDWLVNEAATRASIRSDDDTKRLLSKAPGADLTKEERDRVAGIDGFMSNAATSIGGVIYKNLGLKVKAVEGENRELLEAKMKTELGLIAIAAMEHDKRIVTAKKKSEDIFGEGSDTTGDKGVYVFRFTTEEDLKNSDKPSGSELVDDKTNLFAPNSRFANKIMGTESSVRNPSFEAPRGPRKVVTSAESGKYYDVAQESQDAVNAQEAQSWEFDDDFVESYKGMIEDEDDKLKLMELLGWKDPAESHIELRAGINGKNAQIESNMQYLEELSAQMKSEENTKMWFPWKFVKNGRFILDTNTFNPQGKKLHRFAIFSKEVEVTAKNEDMQKLAFAMAFGADIDKRSNETSMKTWADIQKVLDTMIDANESDLDILTAFNKGVEVFDHKNGKDTTTKVHPHDIEHAMAGIVEYRRYKAQIAATGSHIGMKSRLPLETDAITSGYILKTLQTPLLGYDEAADISDVKKAVAKGGVFPEDSEFKDYGKQAESEGFKDAYNEPADVMAKKIGPKQEALETANAADPKFIEANTAANELALGLDAGVKLEAISRSFMKAPFMTFNYGSGLNNIINAIGDSAIENFYKMITNPAKEAQLFAILDGAAIGAKLDKDTQTYVRDDASRADAQAITEFTEAFKNATPAERLEMRLPEAAVANIKSNINAVAGQALKETFNDTYGAYIEAGQKINASFTLMFRLFKAKVDIAIEAKQLELGKDGKRRHLTTAEMDEVIKSISDSLPAIKTALAGDNDNAKLMIYKTESTFYDSLDGEVVDDGQGRIKTTGSKTYSSQSKAYQLVEAAASGAVVPIHYIDGSIQALVANSGVSGLGVHDAWMLNIDEAMAGTQEYNKATAKLAAEYSLTAAIVSGVNESINNSTKEEQALVNTMYEKEYIIEKNRAIEKEDAVPTINSIHTDMDNLYIQSEDAREKLFSEDLHFEHAALEGSGITRPAGYERITPDISLDDVKGSIAEKPVLGSGYTSPLDIEENPAIIAANIISPTAIELGIDIDKAIAAEYAKAENKFKKCNK